MAVLLFLPLLGFLSLFVFILLFKKKWIITFILFCTFLMVNYLSETIAPNLFFYNDKENCDFVAMCYNVRCRDKSFYKNQQEFANQIIEINPDILYLCEFSISKGALLDSILTHNRNYIRSYIDGSNCAFYSRCLVDSVYGIDVEGVKKRHNPNVKVHAVLKGRDVSIIGCHLASSQHHLQLGYDRRRKEADAIYESIKNEKHPIIVMGDLNDISVSYAVERIKEAELKDAWWEGGIGYGTTFHDKGLRLRLDHILYQDDKLKLHYIKVIDSDLSDHNALVAGFTFKE